ncbi:hypothetical protein AB0K25_19985 [Micromonospora sp. NPDC049257]|uniref:hypothetical protein n=1 Tax=Micromonospora sp. NPDC049257 TaxID=3155771 RepID=UPI003445C179
MKAEILVGGGAEEVAESGAAFLAGPTALTTCEFVEPASIDGDGGLVASRSVVAEPRIDRIGQFATGYAHYGPRGRTRSAAGFAELRVEHDAVTRIPTQ